MNINGKVLSTEINVQVPKNGGGSYKGSILRYVDSNTNKSGERAFHENTFKFNKGMFEVLKSLNPGDFFVMSMEKKDGFWNPIDLRKSDGTPTATSNTGQKTSNYQVNDEKRQMLIVRQSCLSNAIEFIKTQEGIPSLEQVLEVAKEFEMHVFRSENDANEV